ncbi:MAG: hypothetical protein CMG71_03750 [Candidatus Marinimicrobia bacterium]|nr:hypothetical protein [Candidatus Neomarinimicrobiota bacterium]|tara:strand:+ start:2074 stop:3213 length:1140 start_codon:yes stop_codon:yes gene_type:complete
MKLDIVGQQEIWNRLLSVFDRNRIGNAYLFQGPAGSGKEAMAVRFASFLNCQNPSDTPCFSCPSCSKFDSLQHPNLMLIVPFPRDKVIDKDDPPLKALATKTAEILTELMTKKGEDPYIKLELPRAKTILINSIREIKEKVYLKAVESGQKMILIFEAEKLMSQQGESANALLKVLEEPPPDTTLILCTEFPERLFDTIRSRCQAIYFPAVMESQVALHLEEGFNLSREDAMLIAHLSQGNVRMARSLADSDLGEITSTLQSMLSWVVSGTESGWRKFLAHGAVTYRSSPAELAFQFKLLSYWFRDALHAQKFNGGSRFILSMMKDDIHKFNARYASADYPRIITAVETCTDSLSRNFQLNLVLMDLLMEVRDGLNSRS